MRKRERDAYTRSRHEYATTTPGLHDYTIRDYATFEWNVIKRKGLDTLGASLACTTYVSMFQHSYDHEARFYDIYWFVILHDHILPNTHERKGVDNRT